MSKIIVYTGERFTGKSAEFVNNVKFLGDNGLNDAVSSLKVIGVPWVAYCDANFTGKHRLFEQGEYPTLEDKCQFSSLRKITEDLENPEIQLFEHCFFKGRSVIIKREMNLHQVNFSDVASSHKVLSGVWVLYEHIDRQGKQLVCFPGQEAPNYCEMGYNDSVSHVRPLQPGYRQEATNYFEIGSIVNTGHWQQLNID